MNSRKTTFAALLTVAALFAASCQKENGRAANPEGNIRGPMSISAKAEGVDLETKADLAYRYDVLWHEDDQIYVVDATGHNSTFTLIGGEGTTVGTFTQDVPDVTFDGEVQAFYPASVSIGSDLVWPASQSVATTTPMYSRKTLSGDMTENFSFRSLGAVLQIVFNSTIPNVTLASIQIKDGEKTLSGTFSVDGNGQAVITATDKAGVTLDLGPEGKILGEGANYFFIAVPAGNYQDITLTFTGTDRGRFVIPVGKLDIRHNTVGRLTLTGNRYYLHTIPGVFTVSPGADATEGTDDDVKVNFAPGNLRYTVATQRWSFFDNQYDRGPATYAEGHDREISLFTWGYGVWSTIPDTQEMLTFPTEAGKSKRNFSPYDDWGGRLSDARIWRTPTKDEWEYVVANRTDCRKKIGHAVVCGVCGMILLPDSFEDPNTNAGQKPFVPLAELASEEYGFENNIYASGSDWTAMEVAGAVFLPVTGMRSGTEIKFWSDMGCYWTSTAEQIVDGNPFRAMRLLLNAGNPGVVADTDPTGFGVRLITDVL